MTNEINARLATLLDLRDAATDPEEQAALDRAIAALRAQLPPEVHAPPGTATIGGDNYGQTIGVNLGIAILGRDPKEEERRRIVRYLDRLACSFDHVPLRGLYQRTARQQDTVSLPKVYTLLATTERVRVAQGRPAELTTYLEK
ncbi:MAG: hypothetical protein ACLFVO_23390, partial [Chloroflexaceae bacterium]